MIKRETERKKRKEERIIERNMIGRNDERERKS